MVSRENRILLAFVSIALGLSYGGYWFTDLPSELFANIIIAVGISTPMLVKDFLEARDTG